MNVLRYKNNLDNPIVRILVGEGTGDKSTEATDRKWQNFVVGMISIYMDGSKTTKYWVFAESRFFGLG